MKTFAYVRILIGITVAAGWLFSGCNAARTPTEEISAIQQIAAEQFGLSATYIDSLDRRLAALSDSLKQHDAQGYLKLQPDIERATVWLRHAHILAIHDHCMPLMGDLVENRAALGRLADSLRKSGTPKNTLDSIAALRVALQQADDDMMQWMRTYKHDVPKQKIAFSVAMQYLGEEYRRVSAVDSSMVGNIRSAKTLLKQYAK
jgi:hypothetical protein